MIIDCDTCEVRGKACGDCVVSFLTIPVRPGATEPAVRAGAAELTVRAALAPVTMDDDQAAAVQALVEGGLVPPLRRVG